MRTAFRQALFFLALLAPAWAGAVPALAAWKTYTVADGMPSTNVRGMIEDHAETMWFATNNGLSHYDGVTWRTWTTGDGLASNNLVCAFAAGDGSLWFGSMDGGVSRLAGDTLTTTRDYQGLGSNNVQGIIQDRAGYLWFATGNAGARRYDGRSWEIFSSYNWNVSPSLWCIFEDHDGNLWFGSEKNGVTRLSSADSTVTRYGLGGRSVHAISEDDQHNLWFATDAGVSRRDSLGNLVTYTTADGLVGDDVWSILHDRNGKIWFGTKREGVSLFDGGSWRNFHAFDGLWVRSIIQDRSGNRWFATEGGAVRYDGVSMETFPEVPELSTALFITATEDRDGTLWFGSYSGMFRFDGTQWRHLTTADGLADIVTGSVLQDHLGNYWFPSFGGGIAWWDGDSTWTTFTAAKDGLVTDFTRLPYEDRSHNIWVTGSGGVSRFDGSRWTSFTTQVGLGNNDVFFATQDRDGYLWFATNGGGVSRFDGVSEWRTFTTADGLANDHTWGVFQDREGYLWFGGGRAGATRFDGVSEWRVFTSEDGLSNDDPLTITQDRDGNLWFAMDLGGGACRWDGTNWRTLGLEDGLPSSSLTYVLQDRHGDFWFATFRGLARYEPDRVPPRTVIVTPPPVLSASRNQTAVFGALGESGRLEFSYRLDGGGWSEWSASNSWSDQDLPDGVHTLEVMARDYWTNVDSTAETATFEIDGTPPVPGIASPAFGSPVQGTVAIQGTAADARFLRYQLAVRRAGAGSWTPPDATVIAASSTPVVSGPLGDWDTSGLVDGNYELRLSVTDDLGLTGAAQVTVVVDNVAPFFDQTTPVKVIAETGGDIYTTGGEFHLYIPPRGFAEDAVVTILPLSADDVPSTLPNGASSLGLAYDLEWAGTRLTKPGTLDFALAGVDPGAADGVAALYHSTDGATWTRLGGTEDPGGQRLSLPITGAGRYALYRDAGAPGGSGTLTALTFTPRVYSPRGSYGSSILGIGFVLGRPGAVTVKVYDTSGRLVKDLVDGRTMGAGANLVHWDGRNRDGNIVLDGLYLVTVEAFGETRKKALAVVR